MFGSFLRKAGRYQGIIASDGHSQGRQQIVLVEVSAALNHDILVVCERLLFFALPSLQDLPNAFYREPAKFHEIIR